MEREIYLPFSPSPLLLFSRTSSPVVRCHLLHNQTHTRPFPENLRVDGKNNNGAQGEVTPTAVSCRVEDFPYRMPRSWKRGPPRYCVLRDQNSKASRPLPRQAVRLALARSSSPAEQETHKERRALTISHKCMDLVLSWPLHRRIICRRCIIHSFLASFLSLLLH